jgi:5,10-methylenetetrahydrofolate reductase
MLFASHCQQFVDIMTEGGITVPIHVGYMSVNSNDKIIFSHTSATLSFKL